MSLKFLKTSELALEPMTPAGTTVAHDKDTVFLTTSELAH